jgi:hypothetical protein
MKIWTTEHVFNHPWEVVAKAALQKYPNPINPGVIGVDVVDRKIDNDIIKSHRLLISQWTFPSWIAKLLGGNRICFASEHSQIDRVNRTMLLRSRNLTFNNIINVDEKLCYYSDPTNESRTLLKQEAIITVQNVPLTDYLETFLTTHINSNASKGRQAIEFMINKMNNITDDAAMAVQTKFGANSDHL